MDDPESHTSIAPPRAGPPRRGMDPQQLDGLLHAATKVFVQEGYGLASIEQIAAAAGLSTRTIYERFKNKADLMAAVVTRLVDKDMELMFEADELDEADPEAALTRIGRTLIKRLSDPDSAALFRIIAAESQRFPELTAKVRSVAKARLDAALGAYMARQMQRGAFVADDPERAAALFLQMVKAELQDFLLFKSQQPIRELDHATHVTRVVRLFLYGAAPRTVIAAGGAVHQGT